MSAPFLIYSNIANATFSSSVGDSSYPPINLKTFNTIDVWESANSSSYQSLYITFPSNETVTDVVMQNHNWWSVMDSGNIQLQYADDAGFTSGVTVADSVLQPPDSGISNQTIDSVSKRYWRVYFSGSLNTKPYIGNLFLGRRVSFTHAPDLGGRTDNHKYDTVEKISIDGTVRTSQVYGGRSICEYDFTTLTDSFKTSFMDFLDVVRCKLYPFYFVDENLVYYYGHLDNDYTTIDVKRWYQNDIKTFRIKAQKIGDLVEVDEITRIYEDEILTGVS